MASNPSSASAAAGEAPSNSLLKDLKTGGHKTRLTPTPTAVHVRLPSREDIQLEKKAQQVEHMERVSAAVVQSPPLLSCGSLSVWGDYGPRVHLSDHPALAVEPACTRTQLCAYLVPACAGDASPKVDAYYNSCSSTAALCG